jgi:predicted alpha/beta hydrolase family esterase
MFAQADSVLPSFVLISTDEDPTPPWMAFLDAPDNEHLCVELRSRKAGIHNRWATRLDQTVGGAHGPVLLVANGASCLAVAWWARLSPSCYVAPVAGAIFLDPSNPYAAGAGGHADPFLAPPTLLPFPSVVLGTGPLAADLARSWGSRLADPAAPEPLAVDAGPGAWRASERLLARGLAAIGRGAPPAPSINRQQFVTNHRVARFPSIPLLRRNRDAQANPDCR